MQNRGQTSSFSFSITRFAYPMALLATDFSTDQTILSLLVPCVPLSATGAQSRNGLRPNGHPILMNAFLKALTLFFLLEPIAVFQLHRHDVLLEIGTALNRIGQ
jgi:hypothetical protein